MTLVSYILLEAYKIRGLWRLHSHLKFVSKTFWNIHSRYINIGYRISKAFWKKNCLKLGRYYVSFRYVTYILCFVFIHTFGSLRNYQYIHKQTWYDKNKVVFSQWGKFCIGFRLIALFLRILEPYTTYIASINTLQK